MIESLLIEVYIKNIDTEIALLSDIVSNGKCENFDDYKKKTGEIKGLTKGKSLLISTIKAYKEDDIDYTD